MTSLAPKGSGALVTPDEMLLLVMFPFEDQVVIIQTSTSQTIGELEEFVVDEYARVFPTRPALNRNLRIQKCVPLDLAVNRRKRTASEMESKKDHSFVDLSKSVQVGNVFENMEQIYVVFNRDQHLATPQKPIAVSPAPADVNGKKKGKKQNGVDKKPTAGSSDVPEHSANQKKKEEVTNKKAKPAQPEKASTDAPTATPPAKKAKITPVKASAEEKKTNAAPAPTTSEAATATSQQGTTTKKKRGKKAAQNDAVAPVTATETAPVEASQATKKGKRASIGKDGNDNLPPTKRSKAQPTTDAKKPDAGEDEQSEPVKKRRGRPPKAAAADASPSGDKNEQPAVKEVSRPSSAEKNNFMGNLSVSDRVALLRERMQSDKRTEPETSGKEADVATSKEKKKQSGKSSTVENGAANSTDEVKQKKTPTKGSMTENGKKNVKKDTPEQPKEAPKKKVTKTVDDEKNKKVTDAAEQTKKDAPKKKGTKDVSSEQDKNRKDADVAPADVVKPAAKAKFGEFLASKRMEIEAKKKDISNPSSKKVLTTSNGSTTSSDSDFEDVTPRKASTTIKPITTPKPSQDSDNESTDYDTPGPVKVKSTKGNKSDSDSSDDDDDGLDYSQNLLAELAPSEPAKKTKSTPSKTDSAKKTKPTKTKITLPEDESEIAPESSQETVSDLSQDLLSQKTPESNSVLVSSLRKNRFSLNTVPVAKLKKSAKNPFSKTGDKAAQAGGRRRKSLPEA